MAGRTGSLVATVGQLEVPHSASNVIPGEAWFTIDIRDASDAARERFCTELFAEIEQRMERRSLETRIELPLAAAATTCSPRLCDRLDELVLRRQARCPRLVSGAGHDAVALAEIAEVAMLFVRCREGLSHHPDEFAEAADISLAVDVLAELLADFPKQ
jgi:acetylornithine deacetylase/succinyl-diaminopimelate desuccinylase-like protein